MFSNPKVGDTLYYVNKFNEKVERVSVTEINPYGFSVNYSGSVKSLPKSALGTRLFLSSGDALIHNQLSALDLAEPKSITSEELRTQYHKCVKLYHPDVAQSQFKDGEKFKKVKAAYDSLSCDVPAINAYLSRRKSDLYKFFYLPPAQPRPEAPKARTYPSYAYNQNKYAYRAYESPRYGYRKTYQEPPTKPKPETPPQPEPEPPPKKAEPTKRKASKGSVIGITFNIAFAVLLLAGALFAAFATVDNKDISENDSAKIVSYSPEDRYIARCYFCDAGITNYEAYSYQYIDGHEAYKCESCLNKHKSSPSDCSNIEAPSDGFQDDGYIHVYLVGEGETVSVKNSSWITAITYYPDCGHLIITSGSKRYAFANVSESTWNSFKAAPSKGSFYNSTFKGDSQYWVDDYDGTNGSLIHIEEWNPEY